MLFGPLHIAAVVVTSYAIKLVSNSCSGSFSNSTHDCHYNQNYENLDLNHQVRPPNLDDLPLLLLHRQRHVLGNLNLVLGTWQLIT